MANSALKHVNKGNAPTRWPSPCKGIGVKKMCLLWQYAGSMGETDSAHALS